MANYQLRLAAQLCAASYYDDVVPAWALDSVYAVHQTDNAYLIEGVSQVWVVFRGTEWSIKEWLKNFQLKKVSIKGLGTIHEGFFSNLLPLWQQLEEHPAFADCKINFCGHSRGGALAQLAAVRHKRIYGSEPRVYTFGSPRVGNKTFVAAYNDIKTLRLVHTFDIVPQVPRWNFWHAGASKYKFKRGHAMWRYQKSAFEIE